MRRIKLSIVILNYNTKDLLEKCLGFIRKAESKTSTEVIVVDNGSVDGSVDLVKNKFSWVKIIENARNVGFAAGNNLAKNKCQGEYVLFLNSDAFISENVLKEGIGYLDRNPDVGALTCKLVLASGKLDKDARRSFPTPWVSFTHLVLPLDKFFPKSRIFARYWYGYLPSDKIHEVDVIQGAFFLTRRRILDEVGWFDEDYFLDGEDIDLCWRIKEKGWKIIYFPEVAATHLKGASKGRNKVFNGKVGIGERIKFRLAGVNSMELFYKKHLWGRYPLAISCFVIFGINCVKIIRIIGVILS